ncbi:hypothetical protein NC653_040760 [Populus alba x Populus x berolinensis]|uniref:Uncharacterized protein n=1 Tax=Populus alba x Populus x berolinensis TaxID=444605 RepID=A0AAD6L756_9ROSI|nr:hypothetical protein NC653_040760 [Populus alba x Populus x berolinensis]
MDLEATKNLSESHTIGNYILKSKLDESSFSTADLCCLIDCRAGFLPVVNVELEAGFVLLKIAWCEDESRHDVHRSIVVRHGAPKEYMAY